MLQLCEVELLTEMLSENVHLEVLEMAGRYSWQIEGFPCPLSVFGSLHLLSLNIYESGIILITLIHENAGLDHPNE